VLYAEAGKTAGEVHFRYLNNTLETELRYVSLLLLIAEIRPLRLTFGLCAKVYRAS
jgi:hypothetical protein